MFHSTIDDLNLAICQCKTNSEERNTIRMFYDHFKPEVKSELLKILRIDEDIGKVKIELVIERYLAIIFPSLLCEHSHPLHEHNLF